MLTPTFILAAMLIVIVVLLVIHARLLVQHHRLKTQHCRIDRANMDLVSQNASARNVANFRLKQIDHFKKEAATYKTEVDRLNAKISTMTNRPRGAKGRFLPAS